MTHRDAPLRDGLSQTEPKVSALRASIPSADALNGIADALEKNADMWAALADYTLSLRPMPPSDLALEHIRLAADDYLRAGAIRAQVEALARIRNGDAQ